MEEKTPSQYKKIIAHCQELFDKKHLDYGTSWRPMRLPTVTDQIFIKAKRIRTIQEKGIQKVKDGIPSEFIGIINYSIVALIQIELIEEDSWDIEPKIVKDLYAKIAAENLVLLQNKNHDYGEAWRDMHVNSMTDLILVKLLRIKKIEENAGKTLVSEGVESIYRDMINYAVFCLIQLNFLQVNENT